MAPPIARLASCCRLVKCCRNIGWRSVRSLGYATCPDVPDSSWDTSDLLETPGKFKVIESVDALKSERDDALLFIRSLQESGFKHDLETYMAVVRLVCDWDWGMDETSNEVLNDVIDNTNWGVANYEISDQLFGALMDEELIEALDVLVEVYASAGRFEEAIHTLSEMQRRDGLVVSTATFNFLLNKLIERGKEDMVESVYRQLKSNGLIPNVYTYGILMMGYCRKGRLRKAWDVIEQMEKAGAEYDFIYGLYIHGLSSHGKTSLAYQVVKNLRESNKPIDVFAYASVIRGFVEELKLQDAEDVFRDMKLRGVVLDEHCYRALIRGYCQNGDIDKALDLCKEMESRGIKTDHLFVRWMMQYVCGLGMLAETLCVFKHFMQQSRVFLDGALFDIAIDAASNLGKIDDVVGLVEEMKRRKIKPLVMHALEPTGVQPNVGQQEGVEGVADQDAREQDFDGQLHQVARKVVGKCASLYAHHDVILKNLRKSERR